MKDLAGQRYWDSQYQRIRGKSSWKQRGKFGTSTYADYILWENVYRRVFHKATKWKVLEVGSAPGVHLLQIAEAFDIVPYGIDYSLNGIRINRTVFSENGIDPDNAIHADFFSEEIQLQYRSSFDVVISRGFIEHFKDVQHVVELHLNLLKPGGFLVVTIPNLLGIYYILTSMFFRNVLKLHNLSIMNKTAFCSLFQSLEVIPITCGYYGTFNFGVVQVERGKLKRSIMRVGQLFQVILNGVFRLVFGKQGRESSYMSPYLLFVGVKK
ncbi:MAG: class I SAM-dependent methyltransferase [Promethearchaeota archaeon]